MVLTRAFSFSGHEGDNNAGTWTKALRSSGWKLGDIVYSTPVAVGSPSIASVPRHLCGGYGLRGVRGQQQASRSAGVRGCQRRNGARLQLGHMGQRKHRNGNLPTTATASLGEERWAYIPSNLLSVLQNLATKTYGG